MAESWDELENKYNQFKDWAPDGDFKVKVDKVEVRESSTGTKWMDIFLLQDEQYSYPRFSHPISSKNAGWRKWHFHLIFMQLGASKEDARKAADTCEAKGDFEKIAAAYVQAASRLAAKHPEIEIKVWTEPGSNGNNYARADFKDSKVSMGSGNNNSTATPAPKPSDNPLEGAEEITVAEEDFPF